MPITSNFICIAPVSPYHEASQESQTQSNIWQVLRVMDSLPQVVVGGGSYGLYGPWKFKRVNTCGCNTHLAHSCRWRQIAENYFHIILSERKETRHRYNLRFKGKLLHTVFKNVVLLIVVWLERPTTVANANYWTESGKVLLEAWNDYVSHYRGEKCSAAICPPATLSSGLGNNYWSRKENITESLQ